MNAVPTAQRVSTYDGFVANFASSRPLPSLGLFGADVPAPIMELLNRLYRSLAALDYRNRLMDFDLVFRQIDKSIYVLQHEAAYARWREQKRQRRTKT
jgi:hypothetical protein